MKLGYFADGPWSHRALDKILGDKRFNISFICARYNHTDIVLKQAAEENSIPFYAVDNINSEAFILEVSKYKCDLFVSMSFNQIFKEQILKIPLVASINCHAGKLPFYRGRNILNWALINDEKEFGITVHFIDLGIDTGDIINQKVFPINDNDNYKSLLEKAYVGCSEILYETICFFLKGEIDKIVQSDIHPIGSFCTTRKEGDEKINWNSTSREIFNFVRAIAPPGPSARCFLDDQEIKINSIQFLQDAPIYKGVPGSILVIEKDSFLIKTQDSFVRVIDWESPIKLKTGDRLK